MFLRTSTFVAFALLISAPVFAQGGRIGEKIPEFQLQSTDGQFRGIRYADNVISVIHLVGYD